MKTLFLTIAIAVVTFTVAGYAIVRNNKKKKADFEPSNTEEDQTNNQFFI